MLPGWARGPALAGVAKPITKDAAAIIEVRSAAQNPTRQTFLRVDLPVSELNLLLASSFLVDWDSLSFFIGFSPRFGFFLAQIVWPTMKSKPTLTTPSQPCPLEQNSPMVQLLAASSVLGQRLPAEY